MLARSRRFVLAAALCASCSARSVRPTQPHGPTAWTVAFERELGILPHGLAITRGGDTIAAGGFRFDDRGRFVTAVPLQVPGGRLSSNVHALLGDGRAIATVDSEPRELLVGRLDQAPEQVALRAKTEEVFAVAVSIDESRVATLEGNEVVVRRLPDLTEDWRAVVGTAWSGEPRRVAFLSDHRVVALTLDPNAVEIFGRGGSRATLPGAGANVAAAAFSRAGDAGAIAFDDGRIHVVALPSGRLLGALPRLSRGDWVTLAVSDDGTRVAIDDCEGLRIYERAAEADAFAPVFAGRNPERHAGGDCDVPPEMMFAPGGRALLVQRHQLTVIAPGKKPAPHADPDYRVDVPEGFVRELSLDWRGEGPGTGWGGTPRRVHGWFHDAEDEFASVTVELRDADELAVFQDLHAWGDAFLARYEDLSDREDGSRVAFRRAWTDARGRRALEYAMFIDEGCEPENRYVRVVEDGATLIHVTLTTPPGVSPRLVRDWLRAFVDQPLGAIPASVGERRVAASVSRRGC